MNRIKKTVVSTKNHISRNRVVYAVGAVAVGAVAVQQKSTKEFYSFLAEKNIDPMEFYNPEMFAELNA